MPAQRDSKGKFVKASAEEASGALDDLEETLASLDTGPLDDLEETLDSITGAAAGASDALRGVGAAGDDAGKGAKGLLSMAQAMEKLKKQQATDSIHKKNEETMRSAAKALGINNEEADKLIGKRAALQGALGGSMGNALSAAQQLGGPLGNIASKVQNIGSLFGRVPPQVAAVLIIVTALAAAVTAAGAALYKMAETAVDVVGKLSMFKSVLGALHGSEAVGGKISDLVNRLGGELPIATEKIGEWAKSLSMVAQNGRQLESMLKAVAAAQAIMGDSGASAAQSTFETLGRGGVAAASLVAKLKSGLPEAREELAKMGLKTADLAAALGVTEAQLKTMHLTADQMNQALQKALQKKGAGPLEEMALTFPVMLAKLKEGFLSLFDNLAPVVKPFMQAVKQLFGEFSKGGDGIKAIKPIVTAVMQALFTVGTWAVQGLSAVWQVLKPHVIALAAAIQKLTGNAKAMSMLKTIAFGVFYPLITIILQVVAVITTVIDYITMTVEAFEMLSGAVSSFSLGDTVSGWVDSLSGLASGAMEAASNFVSGLVQGISAGAGAVADAVKGLASGALSAFTGVLGIKSPSRVMLEHGEDNIAGAAATGVERGTPKMEAAMSRMGESEPGGAGKGGGGGKGVYIDLRGATFNGTDEGLIRLVIAKVWEEVTAEAGAQPQGAT